MLTNGDIHGKKLTSLRNKSKRNYSVSVELIIEWVSSRILFGIFRNSSTLDWVLTASFWNFNCWIAFFCNNCEGYTICKPYLSGNVCLKYEGTDYSFPLNFICSGIRKNDVVGRWIRKLAVWSGWIWLQYHKTFRIWKPRLLLRHVLHRIYKGELWIHRVYRTC